MLQLRCPLLVTLLVTSLVVRFRFTKKCLRTFLRKRSGRLLGGDVLPLDWNGRVRVEESSIKGVVKSPCVPPVPQFSA